MDERVCTCHGARMHAYMFTCDSCGVFLCICEYRCTCLCTCECKQVCAYEFAGMRVCMCDCERGRWVGMGTRVWAWPPVMPIPSPHSYIENEQHLQRLELSHLKGLGELRNL